MQGGALFDIFSSGSESDMIKKHQYFWVGLLISLPLVFTLMFFGYFKPQFDLVIYTDNIKGEGTCSAYLSSTSQPFAYLYKADAYFGSELKTLRMQNLRYDVNAVRLSLYNVEEADILSYDVAVFGYTVMHHNSEGDHFVLKPMTLVATESNEASIGHILNENPESVFTVDFTKAIGIPTWVWIVYFVFLLLISDLLALGLGYLFERTPNLRLPLLGAASILAAMIMGCFFCGSLPYVDYVYFLLNGLMFFAAALLISALSLSWIGPTIVSTFLLFWYAANYYVISFRNKPIMPADLKAMGTAREVVGGYDLMPTWQMILSIFLILIYTVQLIIIWKEQKKQDKKPTLRTRFLYRVASLALAGILVFFGLHNPAFKALNSFQWDSKVLEGFHREGILLTYIQSAMSAHVPKPEGYSREVLSSWLEEYQKQPKETQEGVQPTRIIMVMNEAFSDLRSVGLDPEINVMPFIDSLRENTIQGNLYVSVIGGGTCNTEFEALTGNTLAFLGSGAYPYTENVTRPLFSLAAFFKENGYITEAFHANEADNWNRDMVYPNLGFDAFHSILDYPEITTLHNYVADSSDYHYIQTEDQSSKGTPRFFFNVTIQNHADYDHFLDVEEADTVKRHESELTESARVYLSLIKASDNAIQEMIENYENDDEPTMIVFFGDHQPYMGEDAMGPIYVHVNSQLDYFKSKFFIWTNYETPAAENLDISANYLPWLILEHGNFPLPPYIMMLRELYEKYPIFTSQGLICAEDGMIYDSVEQLLEDPLIRKYQYIQYANLFDEIDPAWFEVK